MEKNSMDTVIVDAIKMIVEASKGNVSYDVETISEQSMFGKKSDIKRTIVKITIAETI